MNWFYLLSQVYPPLTPHGESRISLFFFLICFSITNNKYSYSLDKKTFIFQHSKKKKKKNAERGGPERKKIPKPKSNFYLKFNNRV
jgi:hypothetical protein